MKKIIISLLVLTAFISCGKKDSNLPTVPEPYILANLQSMPFNADTFLNDDFPDLFAVSTENSLVIRPQELNKHIGDLSEMYLEHQFIGMVTKKYLTDKINVDIEIIQFADETNAYGFYSIFRPHGIRTDKIGVESYQQGNTRYMVKGDYIVQISMYERNDKNDEIVLAICSEINNRILGSTSTPPLFLLFPFSGKIIPSTRYYANSYLDIPGFDQVYTTSYLIENDTVTLFMTIDTNSNKFTFLNHFAKNSSDKTTEIKRFDFPPGQSIAFPVPGEGIVIGGLKSQKLLGTIGYNPKTTDKLLSGWIKGIQ